MLCIIDREEIPENDYGHEPGDICMLPEAEDWYDFTQWFPAEVISFDASRSKREWELRWSRWIVWTNGAPEDLCFYRSARHWKSIQRVKLKDEQICSLHIHKCFKPVGEKTEMLDPSLVKIFKIAVPQIAALLAVMEASNDVIKSYLDYFSQVRPTLAHEEQWLFENDMVGSARSPALGAMLESVEQELFNHRHLDHIQLAKRISLASGPGILLLKLLAVQYNLGENLDLNGNVLSRMKTGLLLPSPSPWGTMKAMFRSTSPSLVVSGHRAHTNLINAFTNRHSVYGNSKDVTFFDKAEGPPISAASPPLRLRLDGRIILTENDLLHGAKSKRPRTDVDGAEDEQQEKRRRKRTPTEPLRRSLRKATK
ncbi:hypothetical protein C8J57DRAFT_1620297 [Mycena rebaudengoi]|nr:hypothetical protein C8J57DRAFT_1620297 [Mycena rebaudengoi]